MRLDKVQLDSSILDGPGYFAALGCVNMFGPATMVDIDRALESSHRSLLHYVVLVNLRHSLRPMPWVNGAHVAERRPTGDFSSLRGYFVNLWQSLRPMP